MLFSAGLTFHVDLRIFAAMNIRYRLRIAGQIIWRRRRFLWRTFEALIALFCLLVTHQAVWVYFQDLSKKLRVEFPNPTVFFLPTTVASSDTVGEKQAVIEVNNSPIDLNGFAPPRRVVILKVNELERSRQFSIDGRLKFYGVPLRRGENTIRGELEEEKVRVPTPREEEPALQTIYFRPDSSLPPKILGVYARDNANLLLVGMADPTTKLFARRNGSATPYALDLDKYGVFQDHLAIRPFEETKIHIWAESHGHRFMALRDSITIAAQAQRDSTKLSPNRSITIALSRDAYKVRCTADLIPGTVFGEAITQRLMTPEDVFTEYFGLALSSFNPWVRNVEPASSHLEVSDGKIELTVWGKIPSTGLNAAFVSTSSLNWPPLLFPGDEMRLEVSSSVRLRQAPHADYNFRFPDTVQVYVWKSGLRAVRPENWLFEVEPVRDAKTVAVQAPVDSLRQSAATPAEHTPRVNVIQQIQQLEALVPGKVRDILTALLKTVPFLWLILVLRSLGTNRHGEYRATLYAATMTFFLFHFILLSFPVFTTSFSFMDPILPLFEASPSVLGTMKDLGQIYPFLAIGIILLFRPLYYTYKRRLPPPTLGRRVQRRFLRLLVFWPAVVVLPSVLFYLLVKVREASDATASAPPLFENYLITAGIFAGVGLLCCWIFLYWLLAVGLGQPIRLGTAIKVSWAMLLLPLFPILAEALARFVRYLSVMKWGLYPFFVPPRRDNLLWFLLIVAVGTALFSQFVELSIRLSQSRRGLAFLRSRWIWLVLPVFVLLSLPMKYVLGTSGSSEVNISDLNALAVGIASLLPSALLIGLITFLRKTNPHDRFELRAEAISVGTILFAYYLSGRTASLLFAPVPLLLGWYVFTRWALVERVPFAAPESAFALQELVRKLLEYKQARHLSASLQRSLEKKYTQGDLTLGDLQSKMKDSQAYVARTAEALPLGEAATKQQIFGHGPEQGPWANAKNALRYGLLLSIPFQASTLINIISRQEFENFPLLQVVNALVFSMTNWFLIAFVFGYFFHKIRGRDGFAKAFVFALSLLVSTIPLRIIDARPLLEQGFVVQIVQILAYVLMLALIAFDLRSLQKLGYTWRDLLTVHGFTTITAYGSSIVLATVASLSGKDLIPFTWNIINWLLGTRTAP